MTHTRLTHCTTFSLALLAAATFVVFGSSTASAQASTAVHTGQPIALMMADGRPHVFIDGKEIDLTHGARPQRISNPVVKHTSAALPTVAESNIPQNPADEREAQGAASYRKARLHETVANSTDEDSGTEVTVVTVCKGQTLDHVKTSMGNPDQIVANGETTVLVYNGIKVTFTNGHVSSVD